MHKDIHHFLGVNFAQLGSSTPPAGQRQTFYHVTFPFCCLQKILLPTIIFFLHLITRVLFFQLQNIISIFDAIPKTLFNSSLLFLSSARCCLPSSQTSNCHQFQSPAVCSYALNTWGPQSTSVTCLKCIYICSTMYAKVCRRPVMSCPAKNMRSDNI